MSDLHCRNLCCSALAHDSADPRFEIVEVGPDKFAVVHREDDAVKYDAHELRELGNDLSAVGPKMVTPMRKVFQESGELLADTWRANAEQTSGVHGKHYPKSIDSELRASFGIVVDVGPNTSKKQGKMGPGFEYGSVNQTTPHLDGQRAADKVGPLIERAIALAVTELLP